MDNKKNKTKWLVRILCAFLAIIMTLSVVLPVVYAAEIEQPYMNGEGFEYVEMDGEWCLNATSDNPVFRLTNQDDSFTRDNVPIVICNVDNYQVHSLNLLELNGYAASGAIKPGYYFVIANNYAWADNVGRAWVINEGKTFYFYFGEKDAFQQGKYDLTYVAFDKIVDIPMTIYTENNLHVVGSKETFHLDESDKVYPMDELHNWDELMDRLENLDLEASLDTGHPVYADGYQPNTITGANMETDPDSVEQVIIDQLNSLSQMVAPPSTATTQNTTPVVEPANNNSSDSTILSGLNITMTSDVNTSNVPSNVATNETQPEQKDESSNKVPNALELAQDAVEEKTGFALSPTQTTKDIVVKMLKSVVIFGVIFAIVFIIYIKMKKQDAESRNMSQEFDFYDDSRIE